MLTWISISSDRNVEVSYTEYLTYQDCHTACIEFADQHGGHALSSGKLVQNMHSYSDNRKGKPSVEAIMQLRSGYDS